MTPHRLMLIGAAGVSVLLTAHAADWPKRRPGLWDVTMESGTPMGGMTAKHCVDEASDTQMQRQAMSAQRDAQCTMSTPTAISGGIEVQADCTDKEGKSHAVSRITGNMQSAYTVDTQITFTPPRHGMANAHMIAKAQYAGACPADMKPGDIRMGSLKLKGPGGAAMPEIDLSKIQQMTPQQRQQLMEQMQKMRPSAP